MEEQSTSHQGNKDPDERVGDGDDGISTSDTTNTRIELLPTRMLAAVAQPSQPPRIDQDIQDEDDNRLITVSATAANDDASSNTDDNSTRPLTTQNISPSTMTTDIPTTTTTTTTIIPKPSRLPDISHLSSFSFPHPPSRKSSSYFPEGLGHGITNSNGSRTTTPRGSISLTAAAAAAGGAGAGGGPITMSAQRPTPRPSISYTYTSGSSTPLPTPPISGGTGSGEGKRFGLDYTTKGRKRKRLAKACSACHKNKRRCDGFAPCSNCEFSSRECVYVNSLGEAIPPPRTREGSILPNGQQPHEHSDIDMDVSPPPTRRPSVVQGGSISTPPSAGPRPSWFSMGRPASDSNVIAASSPLSRSIHSPTLEVREVSGSSSSQRWGGQRAGPSGLNGASSDGNITDNPPPPSGPEDGSHGSPSQTLPYEEREREKRWRTKVLDLVFRDDTLVEELVQLFFTKVPPFSMMFHLATFHHRRFTGEAVPCLIYIMLAFAVRFLEHPLLVPYAANRRSDGKPFPSHLKGEPFAERAKADVEAWVRSHADLATIGRRASAWERTEWAMAMCLIKVYETCMGRSRLALYYQDLAIDMLRPGNISYAQYSAPPGTSKLVIIEAATIIEAQTRTLWMLYLGDCCAAANGRNRYLTDSEMTEVMLPSEEASWQRWGGVDARSRSTGRAPAETRFLGIDANPVVPDEARRDGDSLGEFAHVLRITSIFSHIMDLSQASSSIQHNSRRPSVAHYENALKNWALSLPVHLRFDESNLYTSLQKLSSPLSFVYASGWCYAYMHAMAESGMFYLQAAAMALGQAPSEITSQRQAQAVDNLGVILQSIGDVGRSAPAMLFPLFIVSNWQAHAAQGTPGNAIAASNLNIESKLAHWWDEVSQIWGLQRAAVLSRGFYGLLNSFAHGTSGLMLDKRAEGIPAHRQYQQPTRYSRPPPPLHSMSELTRSTPYSTPRLSDLLNESSARDTPHDRRHQLKPPAASCPPVSPQSAQHLFHDGGSPLMPTSSAGLISPLRIPDDRSIPAPDVTIASDGLAPSKQHDASIERHVESQMSRRQSLRPDGGRTTWAEPPLNGTDRYRTPTALPYPPSRMRSASIADLVSSRRNDGWRDITPVTTTADAEFDRRGVKSTNAVTGRGGEGFAALLDAVEERTRKS